MGCQTFISDVLTFSRETRFETKYTITYALAPFSRFNTFLSTVEFYRNSRLLDGETLSWNSNMPFAKLCNRIQNSIARLTKVTLSKVTTPFTSKLFTFIYNTQHFHQKKNAVTLLATTGLEILRKKTSVFFGDYFE